MSVSSVLSVSVDSFSCSFCRIPLYRRNLKVDTNFEGIWCPEQNKLQHRTGAFKSGKILVLLASDL